MSSFFGHAFRIATWGESHGKAIGVIIEGCPPKISLSEEDIQKELDKRKPGQSRYTTTRKESDQVEILSGVFEGQTTGTSISMWVQNQDQRSKNYDNIKELFRPGHADFSYYKKYGIRDYRGGGRSSGRETVARVSAGAVAKRVLAQAGIEVYAYTRSIGEISIETVDLNQVYQNPVRSPDLATIEAMQERIQEVRKQRSSIGGVVEALALNVPAGLGEPIFDKLDADLAKAFMSIGSVKGVEIGDGFLHTKMQGEESNDEFVVRDGKIVTLTNHSGGILGGISTGMPIVARVAVKPTSSLARPQKTVNTKREEVLITTKGRHDPCIVIRIVPVVESMMALVLCDHFLRQKTIS